MKQAQPHVCPIIVGRDQELAFGARVLSEVAAGRSTFLLVTGEAGIGKSRLAQALTASATDAGFRVLAGVCHEHDRDLPFAAFLDALRQQLHGTATNTPTNGIADLLGVDGGVFARLLPELGPAGEESLAPALPPEQEKRRLFEAFVDLFTRLVHVQPLLLSLEDLHWADATSLELLALLPRRLQGAPLLILTTARSDEPGSALDHWLAALQRGRRVTQLPLKPLTGPEVARMIEATMASAVPIAVVAAIHDRAEGNPFLVEEFLRELADTVGEQSLGALERQSVAALSIPLSVAETIGRRLDSLDATARGVAQLAAVVGRRVAFDLLRALSGLDDTALIGALRALIASQLVIEETVDGEPAFAFRHALTRDAIYSRLLGPERRHLHRVVARTLTAGGQAWSPPPAGELGYHYYAAGEWPLALDYAGRAGDAGRAVLANHEALSHYRRALEAALHLGEAGEPAATALHHKCGAVLAVLGEFDAARDEFAEALRRARAREDALTEGRVLYDLAGLYASRNYDTALTVGTRALELARAAGDARDEAVALNRLGNIMVNQTRFDEGLALHTTALTTFERLADRWGTADCLDGIAVAHYLAGDVPEARAHFQRALAIFEGLGDRERVASCLTNQALYLAVLDGPCPFDGDPDACLVDAEAAARLCREIDWRAGEAYALTAVACAHLARGDYTAALRAADASHSLATQIEHQQWTIISRLTRAIALAELGDAAGAAALLEPIGETASAMGAAQWARRIKAWLAYCALQLDSRDEAEVALRALLPAGRRPRSIAERRALFTLAELELGRGRPERTLELTWRLELAPRPDDPARPIPAILLLQAEALAAGGHLERARERLERAYTLAYAHGPRGLLWRISAMLGALERRSRRSGRDELARARVELQAILAHIDDERLRNVLLQTRPARALLGAVQRGADLEGLTRREREVVAQIAAGKTNRQIADALFIAEKTVEMHVSNSFSKLGFSSRAQLAAWAVGHDLAPRAPAPRENPTAT